MNLTSIPSHPDPTMRDPSTAASLGDWKPAGWHRLTGEGSVEMFMPNHLGPYILSTPIAEGRTLQSISCVVRFLTPEDYDFAGLTFNLPHKKDGLFGISRRNGTVEAKGLGLKEPLAVELGKSYQIEATRVTDDEFDLLVDGRSFAKWRQPIRNVGLVACEAHVRFDHVRLSVS